MSQKTIKLKSIQDVVYTGMTFQNYSNKLEGRVVLHDADEWEPFSAQIVDTEEKATVTFGCHAGHGRLQAAVGQDAALCSLSAQDNLQQEFQAPWSPDLNQWTSGKTNLVQSVPA